MVLMPSTASGASAWGVAARTDAAVARALLQGGRHAALAEAGGAVQGQGAHFHRPAHSRLRRAAHRCGGALLCHAWGCMRARAGAGARARSGKLGTGKPIIPPRNPASLPSFHAGLADYVVEGDAAEARALELAKEIAQVGAQLDLPRARAEGGGLGCWRGQLQAVASRRGAGSLEACPRRAWPCFGWNASPFHHPMHVCPDRALWPHAPHPRSIACRVVQWP